MRKRLHKMLRGAVWVFVAVMLLMVVGCSGKSEVKGTQMEGDSESHGNQQEYTLGIAFSAFEEYHVEWLKYAESAAKEYNINIITTNAENNIATQIADIESLIVQKPDAIMVWAVDADGMVNAVESIYDAGIPCILSSYSVNTDKYNLYLYEDQILTGSMQADFCKQWITEHPDEPLKCGYIWGVTGISGCIDRYNGWRDNCVDGENIILLDEQIGNWSAADAMAITEDWIQAYPEMNCIVCMSDEMALGVIQALQGANKNLADYVILGIDGSESAQRELDKGTLSGTVFQNRNLSAKLQIETVAKLLQGEDFADKDVLIKAKQVMTPANKKEILDSLNQ